MQNNDIMNDFSLLSSQAMNNMQSIRRAPDMKPDNMPMAPSAVACRMVYPEIFYKLQPYILMACDQMESCDSLMPTQDMLEQMCDSIHDEVCRMHPDLAEYANSCERKSSADPSISQVITIVPGIFGRNFRRRGMFRDIIEILLLSELFRRRRRHF